MEESADYKKIKKKYGEKFAKFCRATFPDLIDKNILFEVISKRFKEYKFLYNDLKLYQKEQAFKTFVYGEARNMFAKPKKRKNLKSPEELMKKAGYILKRCTTEDEINSYMKYYEPDELLCTFNEVEERLQIYDIFFAVKENVDDIHREDFDDPYRQDIYGTSVISLQFDKASINKSLSIKNRYNHTVLNPDATFSNDLENIYPGLTESFKAFYGIDMTKTAQNFDMPTYIMANDGKFYKFNFYMNGIYYCPNNVIIDENHVYEIDKSKCELIDYFIIDKMDKKMYTDKNFANDSFLKQFDDIVDIQVYKLPQNNGKIVDIQTLKYKNIEIIVDKDNRMAGFSNPDLEMVGDFFLHSAQKLEVLNLPKVKIVGNGFLLNNRYVDSINMPKLEHAGDSFLHHNRYLEKARFPSLRRVGDFFLDSVKNLKVFDAHNLEYAGDHFLSSNSKINELNLPKLVSVGDAFMHDNMQFKKIDFPSLRFIGDDFFYYSDKVREIDLPNLQRIGDKFMINNNVLEMISLPKLEMIGNDFLVNNEVMKIINFPNLVCIGNGFLFNNESVESLYLPSLERVGEEFLYSDKALKSIDLPKLQETDFGFLRSSFNLEHVNIPNANEDDMDLFFYKHYLENISEDKGDEIKLREDYYEK